MALTLPLATLGAALACAGLVPLVRGYARRRLVDVPGARSSHARPTPTGGGVALVLTLLAVLAFMASRELWVPGLVLGTLVAVLLVAAVGWVDDHRALGAGWRLLAQFAAATAVVWGLGGLPTLALGEFVLRPGHPGGVLAVLGGVWLVNLYNFMDGVDGLAAAEGAFVAGVMAALFWIEGETGAALLAGCLAGACTGFLVWNWSPARIFLGDVGSYTIGIVLALLALYGERSGSLPLTVFLILAAVFVVDATLTLLHRMARGARWYSAHREHAYQLAVAAGAGHGRVVAGVSAINVLVLLPAGLAAWLRASWSPGLLAAVILAGAVAWLAARKRYRVVKESS